MMKKLLVLAIVIVSAFAITACAKTSNNEKQMIIDTFTTKLEAQLNTEEDGFVFTAYEVKPVDDEHFNVCLGWTSTTEDVEELYVNKTFEYSTLEDVDTKWYVRKTASDELARLITTDDIPEFMNMINSDTL